MTESAEFTQIQNLSTSLASLVASTAPSVTAVQSHRSRSSGFVWRPGLVVTADEALSEDGEFAVTLSGGDTVPAKLVGRDPTTDVALLRVDRPDLRPVPLETPIVRVGALAIAVGAEDGAPTAALGIVSRSEGAWRSLRGGDIDARIELDLRLRRSAEGGLVFEATGRAIGMTVFGPAGACSSYRRPPSRGSRRGLRATGASRAAISAWASGSYQSRAAYRAPW